MKKYKIEYKCVFFRGSSTYSYNEAKVVSASSAIEAIDLTIEQEAEKLRLDQELIKCDQFVVCKVSYLQD